MADQKITDLTGYTTPLDADVVPVVDVANDTTKKTTWSNIKATLKTYFDTLYTYTIPVKATGAEINTGTDDAKFATPKAIADSNIAFTTDIPVKASGAELDTGTDDVKFATAKAIKDSHNVPSVAPGTVGNVLTSDGTDWTSSAPASGGTYSVNADETNGNYFTKQIPMISTSTTAVTGWTLASTTITNNGAGSYFTLSPTFSSNLEMSTNIFGTGSSNDYSIANNKTIRIKFRIRVDDSADRKGWGLCITPGNIHTAHTDVTNGEVRFIYNANVLYAQNANGSSATYTDVTSGITVTNWNIYEIVFTPGTEAKFYINGNLVATHTTNLPTSGTPILAYGVNANGRVIRTLEPIISIER